MSFIRKFLGQLLDYLWFWSILLLVIDFFSLHLGWSFGVTLFLPILFIPIEALCITFFKTTLGNGLFGISYQTSPPLKEAFQASSKKGFRLFPLFVPGLNLILLYFFIRNIKNKKSSSSPWIQRVPQKWFRALLVTLSLLLSLFCFAPDLFFDPIQKCFNIEKPGFFKQKGIGLFSSEWTPVTSESGAIFSALFPKEPEFKETVHNIPRSDQKLTYREYTCNNHINFTIGYLELPSSWTKWGSSLVLKGATNFLSDNGGKIVYKKKGEHYSFPAMEYHLSMGGKKAIGKLILVGNTLYRVEITEQGGLSEEDLLQAETFFEAFQPKK